jgi:hypothetical protein
LMLHGREVIGEPLVKRRELIEKHVLPKLAGPNSVFTYPGGKSAGLGSFGKGAGVRRSRSKAPR